MKCVVCRHGETQEGRTMVALDRRGATVIIREVPSQVCQNCGEAYLSKETTAQLLKLAETAAKSGVKVEVREYLAA